MEWTHRRLQIGSENSLRLKGTISALEALRDALYNTTTTTTTTTTIQYRQAYIKLCQYESA